MSIVPTVILALVTVQDPIWSREPLNYGTRPTQDCVARLAARMEAGESVLRRNEAGSFLPGLLEALEVAPTTQTAVFSRTSFQADLITTSRPRALYFSDEVYVGFVPNSSVLELTAVDPLEGLVFYTLQDGPDGPRILREVDKCLQCHAPASNAKLPANLLRSVHTQDDGLPLLRAGSRMVTHSTDYAERWGGWYVTGQTGDMAHLGNRRLGETERLQPEPTRHDTLAGLCEVSPYPVPTSDIVALLVLEHQAHMHTVLCWAGYEARRALHYKDALNRDLELPPGTPVRSTRLRLEGAARKVVDALLLVGEPPLPKAVGEGSAFVPPFLATARRDKSGRSLRDLDLKQRLFRYPLSYLIHSDVFAALPEPLLEPIWLRLWLVLNGVLDGPDTPQVGEQDRKAILEILAETFEGSLPDYW